MTAYSLLFDKVLARTDPELAHHAAFRAIRAAEPVTGALSGVAGGRLVGRLRPGGPGATSALGLDFAGRLGLAAGFDKNAVGIDALANMGFAHVEVGTVTGEPQPGNPRPRLARLTADRAVVNRMGFNNDGAEAVARRLAERVARRAGQPSVPLGINIGKTKLVAEDAAIADYEKSTTLLTPYADYLVVNVSSPNTPGLRDLQAVARLEPLLRAVRRRADDVATRRVPLLVKIAPDLSDADVLDVADLALDLGLEGIVATNTTLARSGLRSSAAEVEVAGAGGLSGPPLRARANEVMRLLRHRVGEDLVLIGVGGITSTADALERIEAGADLLQAYTAFAYEGPLWPGRINREVGEALDLRRSDHGRSRSQEQGRST